MNEKNNRGLALITGSSSGIGLALARKFAAEGHPLLLIAPVAEEIAEVADQLRMEFGVAATGWAYDLADPGAVAEIRRDAGSAGLEVDILCNNAGLGQRGLFWEIPLEKYLEILAVDVAAVVRMTHAFLPAMIGRRRGRILNTASVAGFEPGPNLAVYHASKAFVLSLSGSLTVELEGTGVTLTALCPGPIDTDFFPKADMVGTKAFQKANLMAPQEVAEAAYPALMRGDPVVIPGAINKAMVFGRRLMTVKAQARANKKLYELTPASKRTRRRGDVERAAAAKDGP